MVEGLLSHRSLLGLGLSGSLALLESSLGGCARRGAELAARRGDLPERWLRQLPRDWQLRFLEGPDQVVERCRGSAPARPSLAQLQDGWATSVPRSTWAPFGRNALFDRLDPAAAFASRLFAAPDTPPLAFPWSCNPWVLVLRNRPDLASREGAGWDLLLDASLQGKVVLPSSPRVVMALVGGDARRLCRLRGQALAQDDRHGLNLLLSGPAEAAVLPRPQVVPLLRRDPRLAVVLPSEGGPIAWSLLLRPAGTAISPPEEWLTALLQPPLLPRILAAGWVPPLPRPALEKALQGFPPSLARLLLPPDPVRQRFQNLAPLGSGEREELQALWNRSAVCPPP